MVNIMMGLRSLLVLVTFLLLLVSCKPPTGTVRADGAVSACVRDDNGCLPLGCGGCSPGCLYQQGGCEYLCTVRSLTNPGQHVLAGSHCGGNPVGRECTRGILYGTGANDPPAPDSPGHRCVRLCVNDRLSPGFFDPTSGRPCSM